MIKCNHCGNDVILSYGKPYRYYCFSCRAEGVSKLKIIAAIKFYLGK